MRPNFRSYQLGALPPLDYRGDGGLPSPPQGSEPAGDLGEGIDLVSHLRRAAGRDYPLPGPAARATLISDLTVNHDSGFTPIPGVLPGEKHLHYLRTATLTTLLAIALVYIAVKAVRDPKAAGRIVGSVAGRHVGA
jgi:hypothetical protein